MSTCPVFSLIRFQPYDFPEENNNDLCWSQRGQRQKRISISLFIVERCAAIIVLGFKATHPFYVFGNDLRCFCLIPIRSGSFAALQSITNLMNREKIDSPSLSSINYQTFRPWEKNKTSKQDRQQNLQAMVIVLAIFCPRPKKRSRYLPLSSRNPLDAILQNSDQTRGFLFHVRRRHGVIFAQHWCEVNTLFQSEPLI